MSSKRTAELALQIADAVLARTDLTSPVRVGTFEELVRQYEDSKIRDQLAEHDVPKGSKRWTKKT